MVLAAGAATVGLAALVRTVVNTQDFDLRQVAADRIIAAADSPEQTVDGEPIVGPVAGVPGLSALAGCRLDRFSAPGGAGPPGRPRPGQDITPGA